MNPCNTPFQLCNLTTSIYLHILAPLERLSDVFLQTRLCALHITRARLLANNSKLCETKYNHDAWSTNSAVEQQTRERRGTRGTIMRPLTHHNGRNHG